MTENKALRWVAIVVLLGCLFGLSVFHAHIAKRRGDLRVAQPWEPYAGGDRPIEYSASDIPVEEITGIVFGGLIAGFRHQAGNITYWRMQRYWEDGHWHRVLGMLKLTTFLDPHFIQAWAMLGWHEAYNMAAEMDTDDPTTAPETYIQQGLDSYERGLAFNPGEYELYEDASWTAFDKGGRMLLAAELAEKSILTWDPAPDVTKDGPTIYKRLQSHAYEKLGLVEDSLRQNRDLLRLSTYDHVGIGATISMRERYLPAIRAFQAGNEDEAFDLVTTVLHADARDAIALALLTDFYLNCSEPDVYGAIAALETGAYDWRNKPARIRVLEVMREELPERLDDLAGVTYDWQLDVRRLYENYVAPRGGMGVLLSVRLDENNQLMPGGPVKDGQVVRADAAPGSAPLPKGEARFYLNGLRIGLDDEAPYTVRLDLKPYELGDFADLMLKCEFIAADGSRARWDVALLEMPWKSAPMAAPPGGMAPEMQQKMMQKGMDPAAMKAKMGMGGMPGMEQGMPGGGPTMPGMAPGAGPAAPEEPGHEGHAH